MTYGQLKLRLLKAFTGTDPDLLEGWINDRYQEILGELPWSRLSVQAILQTTAPYTTGTAAVTLGSAAVTGTGTAWIVGMTGRAFRATGRSESYQFTYLSATTGTLDRPYEGVSAPLAGYSIFQSVYPLPSDCALLEDGAFGGRRFTHGQFRRCSWPGESGANPWGWASYMDDLSTPPRMQVELYPAPSLAIGIPYTYTAYGADLTTTTTILQIWMEPTAMVEGVSAKILRHMKDYPGAQLAMVESERSLKGMRATEARGLPPAEMALDSYYTRHRRNRGRW